MIKETEVTLLHQLTKGLIHPYLLRKSTAHKQMGKKLVFNLLNLRVIVPLPKGISL